MDGFETTAWAEHTEVALGPALPGLGSSSGQRAALTAAQPAAGVGAIGSDVRFKTWDRGIKYLGAGI